MNTVERVAENGLCIACGICKAVCPKNCIEYNNVSPKGLRIPVVDASRCVDCGRCISVCPGWNVDYETLLADKPKGDNSFWIGCYDSLYIAWTKDEVRRHNAVSGGIVTELVYQLLKSAQYDCAFLVNGHSYLEKGAFTSRHTREDSLEQTSKSRYLPVSQEQAVSYMLEHPEEKIILVGTSCFVHGIMKLINMYKGGVLDRSRYFIIGLFCDRTMSENVTAYFSRHSALHGEKMKELYFRTKDQGGWPGGVRMVSDSHKVFGLNSAERMKLKDYFQPERCLYCLDKLNMMADISVGDNYTGEYAQIEGSSSVIVRTSEGKRIWDLYKDEFQIYDLEEEKLRRSQHLNRRSENQKYAVLKEKYLKHKLNETGSMLPKTDITLKNRMKYKVKRRKIQIGSRYNEAPWMLSVCLLWKNIKIRIRNGLKRS